MPVIKYPVDLAVEEAEALAVHLGYGGLDDEKWTRAPVDPTIVPLIDVASSYLSQPEDMDEIQAIFLSGGTWFHR